MNQSDMNQPDTTQTDDRRHSNDRRQTDDRMTSGGAPARASALLLDGLTALVRDGRLLGVRTEAPEDDLYRLLLTVSADRPDLYVELFLDGEDTEDNLNREDEEPEDGPRLVALVNWIGSEGDPAILEGDPERPEALLAEVLGAVQAMLGAA